MQHICFALKIFLLPYITAAAKSKTRTFYLFIYFQIIFPPWALCNLGIQGSTNYSSGFSHVWLSLGTFSPCNSLMSKKVQTNSALPQVGVWVTGSPHLIPKPTRLTRILIFETSIILIIWLNLKPTDLEIVGSRFNVQLHRVQAKAYTRLARISS